MIPLVVDELSRRLVPDELWRWLLVQFEPTTRRIMSLRIHPAGVGIDRSLPRCVKAGTSMRKNSIRWATAPPRFL
jgi:hypothetical protein